MMRSLYSAVSGLKTHQTKMDVIGNNISNVNTVAFKATSVNFYDVMYQTTQKSSGANALTGTGGTNAKQIGLGVNTASMKVSITSEGAAQSTGEALDLKISGDSFFVVNNGNSNVFTRDGSFYIDGEGNLCMSSTGYNVMGWSVDETTGEIKKDLVKALRVMDASNQTSNPVATSMATVSGVLDKNSSEITTDSGYTMSVTVYDNLGYSYTVKLGVVGATSEQTSDEYNLYNVAIQDILDADGHSLYYGYTDENGEVVYSPLSDAQKQALWGTGTGQTNVNNVSATKASTIKNMLASGYQLGSDGTITAPDGSKLKVQSATPTLVAGSDAANNTAANAAKFLNDAFGTAGETSFTYQEDLASGYLRLVDNDGNITIGFNDGNGAIDATKQSVTINPVYVNGNNQTVAPADAQNFLRNAFGLTDGTTSGVYSQTYSGIVYNYDGTNGALAYEKTSTVQSYTLAFNEADGTFAFIGSEDNDTQSLNLSVLDDKFADITIDFSNSKNYDNSGTSTLGATRGIVNGSATLGTGRVLGSLTGISVQTNGMIYGSYDNGDTILLGQIAVAQFSNASGLESLGNNCYAETLNSGSFDGIGVDVTAGGGSISTGQLEMSNVDLSTQFTDMITTQRGFQANSRVITTSDTMLEELINLKR